MTHDTPNNCLAFTSKLLMNKGLSFSLATDLGPDFESSIPSSGRIYIFYSPRRNLMFHFLPRWSYFFTVMNMQITFLWSPVRQRLNTLGVCHMSFFTFLEHSSHLVLTSNDWRKQESNNYLCNGRKQQSMLKLENIRASL